ncbi:ABC transporter substrate-binding protein [Aquabacterium sp. OR-4]|uniref:ABC transporter substrate-binding protein n=1 Tax=Aquabacterium sp. OR-4 TaxID=2978127 RepID=UPI0021B40FB5|nr:ABC transporter substrate-binding protein [Aquabacterium sp. OR-4]MDT7837169.1 ABC transporter substrate-binding protein [Aquabacterium sp. OR-4]
MALLATLGAGAAQAAGFKLVLLVPADDTRLERGRLERAALGQATGPAADALKLALADAKLELDAAGATLQLEVLEVADAAAAKAAASRAEAAGAAALVTDLPAAWTLAAADGAKAPVLNIGAASDALRAADCRRNLFHLAPSERMRADALAQWLTARKWSQVLLLTGPEAADKERAATAQAAIARYGLKLAGSKPFKLSGDPRERDLANPLLLTQGQYDVVWVVDSDGEFAQTLPFRTALPRLVVGDGGLVALAWSSRYERYGAPQVTRRLAKAAGRRMESHDWTAWAAGKALVAAAVKAGKGPVAAFHKALAAVELDGSKGVAMSFRAWDGQLRQPLLLSDGQAVIGTAPIEGILHPKNALDTLGADQPEKLCKVRP